MRIGLKINSEIDKEKVKEKLSEILFRSMVLMENIAKERAPAAFGELKRRIHLEPDVPGYDKYILTDGVNYGIFVETGTRPHYVPIEPLKDWAALRFGDENIAYAIRNKIAKKGTKAKPFFIPAKIEVENIWLPSIYHEVLSED